MSALPHAAPALRWRPVERRAAGVRPAPPRWAGPLLALAFAILYTLTSSGTLTSKDGGVMYDTAMAIANRHTLALPPHHHGLPGVHGGFYSKYGIAQSVAEIPLLVLGQAVGAHYAHDVRYPLLAGNVTLAIAMLTNPIIMALAVWLFFLLIYELGASVRGALVAAVLVGAASPYWPYAKSDFSEPLSALALTGAVLYLLRARATPSAGNFMLSGLFVALALLAKLTAAFALPALALYALYAAADQGRVRSRGVAAWGAPVLGGIALTAAYNLARYGRLADTGYHAEDLPFHAPLTVGLTGLLVSPGKGLPWYCPLVLVALALWPRLLRRRRAEGLLALGIAAPTLIVFATYPVWWGGICWGPRYLLPLVPLMLLPLAFLPDVRAPRALVAVLVAVAVLVQVLGVAIHPARYLATGVKDTQYLWTPSASPILAQAWFVGYDALGLVDPTAADAMLPGYPWRHATGTSPTQRLDIAHWSYWWWALLGSYGLNPGVQRAVAALLALGLATTLWGLRRGWRASDPSPPTRRRIPAHI